MQITIDKDVPIPTGGKGRPSEYPFDQMEVGDSFAIPLTGEHNKSGQDLSASRLTSAARHRAVRLGFKFTVRTDKEAGVARAWRVA